MLDTVLKIVSIISAIVNVVTKVADARRKTKEEHQKSNHAAQG